MVVYGPGVRREVARSDQPRPALGRRPWFAFLRRARSLRRFAFAMRVERVPGARCLTIRLGREGPWIHCHTARSRRERLRGIAGVPDGVSLLFAGRSVHGFGLARPLEVVGIGSDGRVVGRRRLAPGGLVVMWGASHVIEIPEYLGPPAVASGVKIVCAAPVVCPYARDALRVRNADREPR